MATLRLCLLSSYLYPVHVEYKTQKFWEAIQGFPMHLKVVPRDIGIDFLGALSYGATGTLSLARNFDPAYIIGRTERILEWDDTTYPFTDEQTRRLVQVYRDLKSGSHILPFLKPRC